MTKAISFITAALVLFLAVGAFVLSYDALQELALDKGVTDGLAWLWPLLIDGAVIVFSLAVLRASLLGESTLYPWTLVAASVTLSVAFNILHASEDNLARVIAAVPPVALALAFELFTGQVKSEVKRRSAVHTLDQMTQQVAERKAELADLDQQADKLTQRVETLKNQIIDLEKERREAKKALIGASEPIAKRPEEQSAAEKLVNLDHANLTRQEQIDLRRGQLAALLDQNQALTQKQLAQKLDVSPATVKRDLQALAQNGREPQ